MSRFPRLASCWIACVVMVVFLASDRALASAATDRSLAGKGADAGKPGDAKKTKLKSAKLGSTRNVHSFGRMLLCGQPSAEDFEAAKKRGIKVVVTLRKKDEVDWDEDATVKDLGLEFHRFGFQRPDALTDKVFDQCRKLLANSKKRPVMLHCASANRVGAIWAAHRVLDDGLSIEDALAEAKTVGLRTPGFVTKVRDYVRRHKK